MATYEYEYTREDGTCVRVQRVNVPMSQSSDPIEVVDKEDGKCYLAERIMSLTADMSFSWSDDVRNSDLPPVDAKPEDVAKALSRR